MTRVTKIVTGNSTIPNDIQTTRVIHNLNNLAPYVQIKEEDTNSPVITRVDTSQQSILIYALETGKSYVITIIG